MARITRAGKALDRINELSAAILHDPRNRRVESDPCRHLFLNKVEWIFRSTLADLGGSHPDEVSALQAIHRETPAARSYAETANVLRGFGGDDTHDRLELIQKVAKSGLSLGLVIDAEPLPEAAEEIVFRP